MPLKNSVAFCAIILAFCTYATAFDPTELYDLSPEGDLLIFEGGRLRIKTTPFAQYFAKHPEARSEIDVIKDHERTYSAIWEVVDSLLYLNEALVLRWTRSTLTPDSSEAMEPVLPELFPGQGRVFADWYTGYLIIPLGDDTISCYSECPDVAGRYTMYAVLHGMMKNEWTMSGDSLCEFWQSQYQAFQQSQEYAGFFGDELETLTAFYKQRYPDRPKMPERDSAHADDNVRSHQFGYYMSIIRDTLSDKR